MGNIQSSSRSTRIDWLAEGPLAPYLDAYKRYLTNRDYAASTFRTCVRSVAHFAQWLHERHLSTCHIDESIVTEFLDEHLPQCQCTGQIRSERGNLSAALGHLLAVLRAQGVISQPPASAMPVNEELRRYDEYMDHARGLAPKTRSMAVRIVGRLLISRFGDDAIDVATITPTMYADSSRSRPSFIANRQLLARWSPHCAVTSAIALRLATWCTG
jgi:integrase/recombinase XerC